MLPKVGLVQIPDPDINRFQQNIVARLNVISALGFLDGALIQGQDLKIGDNQIAHKLGRAYAGYQITRIRKAGSLIYDSTLDADADKFLTLNSSAACTVDLWVW